MYQKILVPIDGSKTSARGLDEALKLAKALGSSIRLIHVVNELMIVATYEGTVYSGELVEALRESGKKILAQAQDKVAAAGVSAQSELLEAHGGQAGAAIVNDAIQSKADLIVLGTHGRRGLSRLVMGSDAEQVVRQASVPVLLVRQSD
jgi:nucleotide-binding universal stress UspA family protein